MRTKSPVGPYVEQLFGAQTCDIGSKGWDAATAIRDAMDAMDGAERVLRGMEAERPVSGSVRRRYGGAELARVLHGLRQWQKE